jgi:WD40 repeat protein
VYCLQFDLATNRLVSGARDRQIFVWDFEKGEVIKKLSGHRYAALLL